MNMESRPATKALPTPKRVTSPTLNMLTPSEIESLRKNLKDGMREIGDYLAKVEPKTPPAAK